MKTDDFGRWMSNLTSMRRNELISDGALLLAVKMSYPIWNKTKVGVRVDVTTFIDDTGVSSRTFYRYVKELLATGALIIEDGWYVPAIPSQSEKPGDAKKPYRSGYGQQMATL